MQRGVALLQMVDVEAAVARLLQFLLRAEIGPGGVVELQIAAAGVVEGLDRLLIGDRQIVEDRVAAGIGVLAHRIGLEPEMERRGRRDAHLRRQLGVLLQELEVLDHRMVGEPDLAGDLDRARLGLHALELDAVVELVDLDVVQHPVEVEMPPGAAEFAVGDGFEPDLFLLLDDLDDLAVLDFLELRGGDLALLALGARFLHRRGAQDGADMVGAKWRLGPLRHLVLRVVNPSAPGAAGLNLVEP